MAFLDYIALEVFGFPVCSAVSVAVSGTMPLFSYTYITLAAIARLIFARGPSLKFRISLTNKAKRKNRHAGNPECCRAAGSLRAWGNGPPKCK